MNVEDSEETYPSIGTFPVRSNIPCKSSESMAFHIYIYQSLYLYVTGTPEFNPSTINLDDRTNVKYPGNHEHVQCPVIKSLLVHRFSTHACGRRQGSYRAAFNFQAGSILIVREFLYYCAILKIPRLLVIIYLQAKEKMYILEYFTRENNRRLGRQFCVGNIT